MAKDKILKPFVGIIAPENKFTVDTIDDLKSRNYLTLGDIVDLNGYYTAGDGAHHKRKIESVDDGSGVQLANGLWATIVHCGEINVSWFGAKVGSTEDQSNILQKAIDYSISKSCCIDFTMKQNGQFLLESPIRFSKDTGDTAGVVKFSRHNSFLVDDSKIGGKYAIQFGWPESSTWQHGRFSGSILGHCFVKSKSRDNVCNGIYIKGGWISSEFLRVDNFNGTGINLDSVHDSSFQKLSVERCGNSDSYAFVASSSQSDTYNCTHISSIQVEQSVNKGMYLKLLRAVITNVHCERQKYENDYVGQNHWFDFTNSTMTQALFSGSTGQVLRFGFTMMGSTFTNVLCEGDNEWLSARGNNSSLVSCNIGKMTLQHPVVKVVSYACSFKEIVAELGEFVSCNIGLVNLFQNAKKTRFTNCNIGDITFSGSRTSGGNLFSGCYITKISRICDTREQFSNCTVELLDSKEYNGNAKFSNCTIIDCNVYSQAVYDFIDSEITNWTQSGNTAYITRGTTIKNHNTPWSFARNYNHHKGTITERTDGVKGGQIYINDGLGNRPNPDVSGEIISPWHVIASWD